jgi:hypothetical protein
LGQGGDLAIAGAKGLFKGIKGLGQMGYKAAKKR